MEWTAQKKQKLKRAVFIISFLIVPTVNFLLFYVYVNLNSILLAFQKNVNGETYWTFDTMRSLFGRLFPMDDEMREIFTNTFATFGINLCLFLVGVFVSYFLYKKIWGTKAFRVLFSLPMIIPGVVVSAVFTEMVGVNGFIAKGVQNILNLDYTPELLASTRFANYTVWANLLWLSFPGDLIIWGGAFARIPDSVLEAANLDGVGWIREIVSIILPIIWPTFILKFILLFSGIFSSSGNVFLLTRGEWGTNTFSNWMYMQVYGNTAYGGNNNAFCYLSAVGLLISAVAITLSLTIRRITNKVFQDVEY